MTVSVSLELYLLIGNGIESSLAIVPRLLDRVPDQAVRFYAWSNSERDREILVPVPFD